MRPNSIEAQFEFVVPDEVVAVILNEDHAAALQAAIDAQYLVRVSFQDTEELTAFAALASFLGKGESACLALAQQRGWWVQASPAGTRHRLENLEPKLVRAFVDKDLRSEYQHGRGRKQSRKYKRCCGRNAPPVLFPLAKGQPKTQPPAGLTSSLPPR